MDFMWTLLHLQPFWPCNSKLFNRAWKCSYKIRLCPVIMGTYAICLEMADWDIFFEISVFRMLFAENICSKLNKWATVKRKLIYFCAKLSHFLKKKTEPFSRKNWKRSPKNSGYRRFDPTKPYKKVDIKSLNKNSTLLFKKECVKNKAITLRREL